MPPLDNVMDRARQHMTYLADLLEKDPHAAADELDRAGDALKNLANEVRRSLEHSPDKTPAGLTERFGIHVVGPHGTVQRTDDQM